MVLGLRASGLHGKCSSVVELREGLLVYPVLLWFLKVDYAADGHQVVVFGCFVECRGQYALASINCWRDSAVMGTAPTCVLMWHDKWQDMAVAFRKCWLASNGSSFSNRLPSCLRPLKSSGQTPHPFEYSEQLQSLVRFQPVLHKLVVIEMGLPVDNATANLEWKSPDDHQGDPYI